MLGHKLLIMVYFSSILISNMQLTNVVLFPLTVISGNKKVFSFYIIMIKENSFVLITISKCADYERS